MFRNDAHLFSCCCFRLCLKLLVLANVVYSVTWNVAEVSLLSIQDIDDSMFTLNISHGNICQYGTINVEWTTVIDPSLCSIAFYIDNDNIFGYAALIETEYETKTIQPQSKGRLNCIDSETTCTLAIQDVMLKPFNDYYTMHLVFNQDTNEISLFTRSSIERYFNFSPPLQGLVIGSWLTPKELELSISSEYSALLVSTYKSGLPIEVTLKQIQDIQYQGQFYLRPRQAGLYKVYIISNADKSIVSSISLVRVVSCDESEISSWHVHNMPDLNEYVPGTTTNIKDGYLLHKSMPPPPPRVTLSLKGVYALSGRNSIVIPHQSLPQSHAWSLSFWIKVIEEPNGEFRTLFYKGNGHDPSRTPSAWLLPHSNHLSLRGSTKGESDVGVTTTSFIPHNEWTLISFVFDNSTLRDKMTNRYVSKTFEKELSSWETYNPITREISVQNRKNNKTEKANISLDEINNPSTEQDIQSISPFNSSQEDNQDKETLSDTKASPFMYKFYINGKMDVTAIFQEGAVENIYPLNMFGDISHKGPKGFIQDITLWESVLTDEHISELYRRGPASSIVSDAIDIAMSLFNVPNKYPESIGSGSSSGGEEKETEIDIRPSREITEQILRETLQEIDQDCPNNVYTWYDDHYDIAPNEPSLILESLKSQIKQIEGNCNVSTQMRLDLLSEASELGHIESLYRWSMINLFGSESAKSNCGIQPYQAQPYERKGTIRVLLDSESGINENSEELVSYDAIDKEIEEFVSEITISDTIKGALGLLMALDNGHKAAIMPLTSLLSSSIGVLPILYRYNISDSVYTIISGIVNSDQNDVKYIQRHVYLLERYQILAHARVLEKILQAIPLPWSLYKQSSLFIKGRDKVMYEDIIDLRQSIIKKLMHHVFTTTNNCLHEPNYDENTKGLGEQTSLPLGTSLFCWKGDLTSQSIFQNVSFHLRDVKGGKPSRQLDEMTKIGMGLTHLAALHQIPEAYMALAHKYQLGLDGVTKDVEMAALYSKMAADISSDEFHKSGGQPIVESDRLDDNSEVQVLTGNIGSEDTLIQHQMIMAEEGHVPSMLAMADLYYFGARGLPRDQPRALDYFERSIAAPGQPPNPSAMCGAASMYIKGEGTDKNITHAVELYEEAAALGSVKALNGLGFAYFYGHGDDLPANKTKAFLYFLAATENSGDSDSFFNTGYCYEHGIGTVKNLAKAAEFYHSAAVKFGHFASIMGLGNLHLKGEGVARSPKDALYYFNVVNNVGPWSGWLRRGFNQYVQGQRGITTSDGGGYFQRSLLCYLHAGELGYEVSQGNSAFILRRKIHQQLFDENFGVSLTQIGSVMWKRSENYSETLAISGLIENQQIVYDYISISHSRLLLKQLVKSSHMGNRDSAYMIANTYLTGQGFLHGHKSFTEAYKWYHRASAMGSSQGSMYVGMMNHFGVGTKKNLARALRYYEMALTKTNMHFSMQYLTQLLTRLCSAKNCNVAGICEPSGVGFQGQNSLFASLNKLLNLPLGILNDVVDYSAHTYLNNI